MPIPVKTHVRRRPKRHKFTPEEQLRGVVGALKSRKTPKQLKPALMRRKKQLERMV